MTSKSTWKAHERATAAMLGTKRNGNTGHNTSDCETELWAIECKSRQEVPLWLTAAMAQARRNAKPGQTPLVVLHKVGWRHTEDMVIMSRANFEAWLGTLKETEETA